MGSEPGAITKGARILRVLLAVVAGFAASGVVTFVVEEGSYAIHPAPPALHAAMAGWMKGEVSTETLQPMMNAHIAAAPVPAILLVIAGHALGALVAGFVIAKIASFSRFGVALAVGALLTTAGGMMVYMFVHPLWFAATDLALPIPMALLGAKLGGGNKKG